MIADLLSNRKLNPIVTELFIRSGWCAKKYQSKFYALFYYENSKQTRDSTNCI